MHKIIVWLDQSADVCTHCNGSLFLVFGVPVPSAVQEILSAEPVTELKDTEEEEEASKDSSVQEQNVMLDWKGDPMIVNPGDKLPFNFR